jgi:hypothetical protein
MTPPQPEKKVNQELRNPTRKILVDNYKALRVIREKLSPLSGTKKRPVQNVIDYYR